MAIRLRQLLVDFSQGGEMQTYSSWQWSNQSALLTGGKDNAFYFYCKRVIDLILATSLLILLLPLMLIICLLIKLDTSGPILFTQERVGARRRLIDGETVWEIRNFHVYKFRSMIHKADPSMHQAYIKAFVNGQTQPSGPAESPLFKLTADPRVTMVGQILRKTSLDELPQLINVLKGEMSLVGPRPVPVYEVAEYQPDHYERLATLPGITGLWQTQGRCQVSFEEMIAMDIKYVRDRTLWLDLKILLLTIPAVLSGRGAE